MESDIKWYIFPSTHITVVLQASKTKTKNVTILNIHVYSSTIFLNFLVACHIKDERLLYGIGSYYCLINAVLIELVNNLHVYVMTYIIHEELIVKIYLC